MATKRPRLHTPPHPSAAFEPDPAPPQPDLRGYAPTGLTPTEIPGVYLNRARIPCNSLGVALTFAAVKLADAAKLSEVLDGEEVKTPAQYMKAVALDPRLSTQVRMEAAKAAAPYYDRRAPQAVDGGVDSATGEAKPIGIDVRLFKHMSDSDLNLAEALMKKALAASVAVGGGEGSSL